MPTSTPPRPHADRKTRPTAQIARDLGLGDEEWIPYGRDKAKVLVSPLAARRDRPDGKLVVVSSITPTPAGDGKTTMTIGLGQALWRGGGGPVGAPRRPPLAAPPGLKGRRHRRRQVAGGADGRDQPALHGRLPRHHLGPQPSRRRARQPRAPRQRPR